MILRIRWLLILILLSGNLFTWYWVTQFFNQNLIVSFLDIGQGDSILIRAPGGRTMLIDGGPGKIVLPRLADALPLFSKSIDLLLESHPDTDHVAGLPDVVKHYRVRGIMKPCIKSDNVYDEALGHFAKEENIPEVCAAPGQIIDLGGGAKMEILSAGSGIVKDNNTASVVGILSHGNNKFLFTGDVTIPVEKYLTYTQGNKLEADVYKVSHHGSKNSNDEKFLAMVKPKISVISAGQNNRYGHPHQEVLDALTKLKTLILRTDQLGTIVLKSDGRKIMMSGKR